MEFSSRVSKIRNDRAVPVYQHRWTIESAVVPLGEQFSLFGIFAAGAPVGLSDTSRVALYSCAEAEV